jgi:hypothetical protein
MWMKTPNTILSNHDFVNGCGEFIIDLRFSIFFKISLQFRDDKLDHVVDGQECGRAGH